MPSLRSCLASALLAASVCAQPIFEFQTPGPFPVLPSVDVECVGALSSASANPPPVVATAALCGFPGPGGFQYAYLRSGGALSTPPGGPIPLPAANGLAHGIRIPIPPGATFVTFLWEFWDAEGSTTWNDAFEVSVVTAAGVRVGAPLVFADVALRLANSGTCVDAASGGTEIGGPAGVTGGPQTFAGALPAGGSFLQVLCVNGGDDSFSSSAAIDDLAFDAPYSCTNPTLVLDQPAGSGSLRLEIQQGVPNAPYLMPVKIGPPGAFPNGWCLGVDLPLADLLIELNTGPPFHGALDSSGGFSLVLSGGVPAGLQIQAGAANFGPAGLTLLFSPQSITTL